MSLHLLPLWYLNVADISSLAMGRYWLENVGLKALLIGEMFQDPKGELCNRLDYRYALYF